MAIVEFSVLPLVNEDKVNELVDKAISVVINSGLKYEVEPNSTTIEGNLDKVLEIVKQAHIIARDEGSGHVVTIIKIDDKKNGPSMELKIKKYREVK